MAPFSRNAVFAVIATACASFAVAAADRQLPINLDADSYEYDRKNNVMTFRNVRITQGETSIEAERANSSGLEFKDSLWLFSGNVVMRSANAEINSAEAEMRFVDYELRNARVKGAPTSFELESVDSPQTVVGRAEEMEYKLPDRIIELRGGAFLSEGENQMSGDTIVYDMAAERVLAESFTDSEERVRITITPDSEAGIEDTPEPERTP